MAWCCPFASHHRVSEAVAEADIEVPQVPNRGYELLLQPVDKPIHTNSDRKMTANSQPNFDPKLTPQDGLHRYEDGRVSGVIGIHDRVTVIYEWGSHFPGSGHTKEALKWLRAQGADEIIACDVGMPVVLGQALSNHTEYWIHMKKSGMVDTLVDDDGYHFQVLEPVTTPALKLHNETESGPGF